MTGTIDHTQLGVLLGALKEMHLQTKHQTNPDVTLKKLQTCYSGILGMSEHTHLQYWNQLKLNFETIVESIQSTQRFICIKKIKQFNIILLINRLQSYFVYFGNASAGLNTLKSFVESVCTYV